MAAIDFESVVLQRSREIPVVVDFWASWCGPCRVLDPVIEQLAAEAAGRWELVKLNTEEQPDIARQYGVRGIPNVKMFHGGEPIAEFAGALPEDEIRRWLDAYLPDERIDVVEAIAARWGAEGGAIIDQLETVVREQPDVARAKLRLAQAVVAIDPARARELIASAGGGPVPDPGPRSRAVRQVRAPALHGDQLLKPTKGPPAWIDPSVRCAA